MFDTVMNLVKEWNVTGICLRLALATFVGVIIGLDREYKNKGAGIKTHALVCIGAAMAMIVNEYEYRYHSSWCSSNKWNRFSWSGYDHDERTK